MNKNFWVVILNFAVALMLALPLGAQSEDEVVEAEPRARRGGVIRLVFRNIPAEDKPNVDGEYQVSNDDGTVMLPYLASRVRVVGKTARQLSDMVRQLYIEQQIYSRPIVMAIVGNDDETAALMQRRITVTGYVAQKRPVAYRPGITLIQALMECGDITQFGSRHIQVTRRGVTRTYDYFSARDRAIRLRPNDEIYVPERGAWESRPSRLLP